MYILLRMIKAKEFRIPFTWENRHITIEDGVWFLPPNLPNDPFVFTGWQMLFKEDKPVKVEYCSGNGTWIVDKAINDPTSNWLAVEKDFERARLIWARAKNAKLTNFALAFAEGVELTKRFFPDASVREIFVNFPDPWPKRRHGKHRIIRPEFVTEIARILPLQGTATLVTDNEEYSQIMIEEMLANPLLKSPIGSPYYEEANSSYGTSYFDELFRKQAKMIRLHRFVRT
ncbi:MAG: tRNA (guanosine(46)-N7)-methyltransferase TrmB [Verrucomicrobia bacterium]|nr:tRNA (guanosine(46)-N7)-methyltransferase TrmB [Verrucomicrobiota bacterium]